MFGERSWNRYMTAASNRCFPIGNRINYAVLARSVSQNDLERTLSDKIISDLDKYYAEHPYVAEVSKTSRDKIKNHVAWAILSDMKDFPESKHLDPSKEIEHRVVTLFGPPGEFYDLYSVIKETKKFIYIQ